MAALLDGPVTEYGLPGLVGLGGSDKIRTAREWLAILKAHKVVKVVGGRPNPSGAAKGTHPVYALTSQIGD